MLKTLRVMVFEEGLKFKREEGCLSCFVYQRYIRKRRTLTPKQQRRNNIIFVDNKGCFSAIRLKNQEFQLRIKGLYKE